MSLQGKQPRRFIEQSIQLRTPMRPNGRLFFLAGYFQCPAKTILSLLALSLQRAQAKDRADFIALLKQAGATE